MVKVLDSEYGTHTVFFWEVTLPASNILDSVLTAFELPVAELRDHFGGITFNFGKKKRIKVLAN